MPVRNKASGKQRNRATKSPVRGIRRNGDSGEEEDDGEGGKDSADDAAWDEEEAGRSTLEMMMMMVNTEAVRIAKMNPEAGPIGRIDRYII